MKNIFYWCFNVANLKIINLKNLIFSLLFGNIFVFFKFQGKSEIDDQTRFVVFGVLLAVCCIGVLLLCFLRSSSSDSADLNR